MSVSSSSFSSLLDSHASRLLDEGRLDEALKSAKSALSTARQGAEETGAATESLVSALELLAAVHRESGNVEEAEAALAEAMQVADLLQLQPVRMANLRTSLATLLDFSQRESEAVPLYEQAISDFEGLTPADTETSAQLRNNLAMIYKGLGKFALAEQHYLRALEALENNQGRQSEAVAAVYNNLGSLYYTAGYAEQAKEMFGEGLQTRVNLFGEQHPDVAQSYCNLATVSHEMGDSATALQDFEKALRILEANLTEDSASYEAVGEDYAALLEMQGEERKATAFRKRMKKVLSQT